MDGEHADRDEKGEPQTAGDAGQPSAASRPDACDAMGRGLDPAVTRAGRCARSFINGLPCLSEPDDNTGRGDQETSRSPVLWARGFSPISGTGWGWTRHPRIW